MPSFIAGSAARLLLVNAHMAGVQIHSGFELSVTGVGTVYVRECASKRMANERPISQQFDPC